jgi:hypothetical protein
MGIRSVGSDAPLRSRIQGKHCFHPCRLLPLLLLALRSRHYHHLPRHLPHLHLHHMQSHLAGSHPLELLRGLNITLANIARGLQLKLTL